VLYVVRGRRQTCLARTAGVAGRAQAASPHTQAVQVTIGGADVLFRARGPGKTSRADACGAPRRPLLTNAAAAAIIGTRSAARGRCRWFGACRSTPADSTEASSAAAPLLAHAVSRAVEGAWVDPQTIVARVSWDALAVAVVAHARAVAIVRTLREYAPPLKHTTAIYAGGTRRTNASASFTDAIARAAIEARRCERAICAAPGSSAATARNTSHVELTDAVARAVVGTSSWLDRQLVE